MIKEEIMEKREDGVMMSRMRFIILKDILKRFECINKVGKYDVEMREIADELIMMNAKIYLPDIMDTISKRIDA